MLCDNCHQRDAVVNLTTIENNAVRQLHLCEQCAAERGVETSVAAPKHPLGEFLQAVQQQSAELGLVIALGDESQPQKIQSAEYGQRDDIGDGEASHRQFRWQLGSVHCNPCMSRCLIRSDVAGFGHAPQ